MTENPADLAQRIAVLEAKSAEQSREIAQLSASLASLGADVQTARRPQWGVWLSALTFVILLARAALAPIDEKIANNSAAIEQKASRAEVCGWARGQERILRLLWGRSTAHAEELPSIVTGTCAASE